MAEAEPLLDDIRVEASTAKVDAHLEEGLAPSDGEHTCRILSVSLKPDGLLAPGDYNERVSITSKVLPVPISVPVHWHVSPEISVSPSHLFLGNVSPKSPLKVNLLLSYADESFTDAKIQGIRGPEAEVAFEAKVTRRFPTLDVIDVAFNGPSQRGYARYSIVIRTLAGGAPKELTVDCSMNVR